MKKFCVLTFVSIFLNCDLYSTDKELKLSSGLDLITFTDDGLVMRNKRGLHFINIVVNNNDLSLATAFQLINEKKETHLSLLRKLIPADQKNKEGKKFQECSQEELQDQKTISEYFSIGNKPIYNLGKITMLANNNKHAADYNPVRNELVIRMISKNLIKPLTIDLNACGDVLDNYVREMVPLISKDFSSDEELIGFFGENKNWCVYRKFNELACIDDHSNHETIILDKDKNLNFDLLCQLLPPTKKNKDGEILENVNAWKLSNIHTLLDFFSALTTKQSINSQSQLCVNGGEKVCQYLGFDKSTGSHFLYLEQGSLKCYTLHTQSPDVNIEHNLERSPHFVGPITLAGGSNAQPFLCEKINPLYEIQNNEIDLDLLVPKGPKDEDLYCRHNGGISMFSADRIFQAKISENNQVDFFINTSTFFEPNFKSDSFLNSYVEKSNKVVELLKKWRGYINLPSLITVIGIDSNSVPTKIIDKKEALSVSEGQLENNLSGISFVLYATSCMNKYLEEKKLPSTQENMQQAAKVFSDQFLKNDDDKFFQYFFEMWRPSNFKKMVSYEEALSALKKSIVK